MQKKLVIPYLLLAALAFNACDTSRSEQENVNNDSSTVKKDSQSVTLSPLNDSPAFSDAILELNSPAENAVLKSNVVTFEYEIKNYKLTENTSEGSCALNCANSAKGQHIHLILNNAPYLAKYETKFSDTLKDGHYIALSFLSRSYHESLKHFDAFDLRQFTVGKDVKAEKADLTKPMLFYSRPKGEYAGPVETNKVLLDFFLVNTELSPEGNKVRVTVNGKSTFMITKWEAYVLEGLPMGENTIKLELLDKDGNVIPGPYNVTERKITLKEKKTS